MKEYFLRCRRNTPATPLRQLPFVLTVAATMAIPVVVQAQQNESSDSKSLGEQLGRPIAAAMQEMMSRRVVAAPDTIIFTPDVLVSEIEFSNTSGDTLEADIAITLKVLTIQDQMADSAPKKHKTSGSLGSFAISGLPGNAGKDVKIQSESQKDAEHASKGPTWTTYVDSSRSMISWVPDLPTKIRLAPGEAKKIPVKINVPPNLSSGEYAAWIVVSTPVPTKVEATSTKHAPGSNGNVKASMPGPQRPDGKPLMLVSATRIIYRAP